MTAHIVMCMKQYFMYLLLMIGMLMQLAAATATNGTMREKMAGND